MASAIIEVSQKKKIIALKNLKRYIKKRSFMLMGMVTLDKRLQSLGSQNTLEIKLNPLKFFSKGLRSNSFYSVSVPYQIFPFKAT